MRNKRISMSDPTEFQIEEYKQVRAELMERERVIGQLAITSFIVSATLISGLVGAFFGKQINSTQLKVLVPYLMLAPLLVVVPIFFIIASHRKDLFRAGAYLQVFYEEEGAGIGWQTRIQQFRAKKKGDSLDTLPWFFWLMVLICGFLMLKELYYLSAVSCLDIAAIFIIIAVMSRAHYLYASAPKSHRTECIAAWKAVKTVDHIKATNRKDIE